MGLPRYYSINEAHLKSVNYYNLPQSEEISLSEFKNKPTFKETLRSIPAILLILVMGLLGEKKKPKGIRPMKVKSYYPNSYHCLKQVTREAGEISRAVKGYTIGERAESFNQFARNISKQLLA